MADTLLISVQKIKDITQLHGNVDEKLVFPAIQDVQNMFLEPLLGTALFVRLKDGQVAGNLTTQENHLIDTYIVKVLAYYTLSELPEGLSMQLYTTGAVKLRSGNSDGISLPDLLLMAKKFKGKAEFYSSKLVSYLKDNASSSLFPEYLSPGTGIGTVRPDNDPYTCSFYLE